MRVMLDKRLLPVAVFALFILLCAAAFGYSLSLNRELGSATAQRNELRLMMDEYLSLKKGVDAVEGKMSLTKVAGTVQAVDDVFLSVGLKEKVKSVKPAGTRNGKDTVEEDAEVQVEKINMNEMVNMFYSIENAPMGLSVKKTVIKKSFDSPALLNVTLVLTLIKAK